MSQKRTGAEDVTRSRSREGSGKNGNVRTAFLQQLLQTLPPDPPGELYQELDLEVPHLPHVVPAAFKISLCCRRTGKRERRAVSQKRTGAEDVGRSRSREGSGKNGNVRTSFLWHALQIHGAPSMRFDLDQDDTASTPASHEAQTRSTGASLPQHFPQSQAPSVNRDLSIRPASAPGISQWAQLPREAATCAGTWCMCQ